MINDITKYINLLCELDINEHQFLILWLVHTKDEENIKKYKQHFNSFDRDSVLYLIDKGYLDDFGILKGNIRTFNIYDFLVTEKFVKRVLIDEFDAYDELISAYPKWIVVKGTSWPTVTGDPDQLTKDYYKCYKGNKLAHERIINITKTYFANNPPFGKLDSYIKNRQWNLLEEKIAGGNQDAFKIL